jgi:hypothetical protein
MNISLLLLVWDQWSHLCQYGKVCGYPDWRVCITFPECDVMCDIIQLRGCAGFTTVVDIPHSTLVEVALSILYIISIL